MKKKIALLLAAIMTMSVMPTTIFASSDNKIDRTVTNVRDLTALFDTGNKGTAYTGIYDSTGDFDGVEIKSFVTQPNLVMQLKEDSIAAGSAFRLKVENAVWLLQLSTEKGVVTTGAAIAGAVTSRALTGGVTTNAQGDLTYTKAASAGQIGFTFTVSTTDPKYATVSNFTGGVRDSYLTIPLYMFVEDANVSAAVEVTANNSPFSSGKYAVVSTTDGKTVNSFATIKTGREEITLDTLILQETRVGTIFADTNGRGMRIIAPAGYEFANNPTNWTFSYDQIGTSSPIVGYRTDNGASDIYYLRFEGLTASTSLPGAIDIKGIKLTPTDLDNVPFGSTLKIDIQKYKNTSSETWINVSGGATFTKTQTKDELQVGTGTVEAAKAVDWTVSLTAGTPKELVAGRWAAYANSSDHQVADITFEEQEIGAWNSTRTTDFILPKGVKIRGIEFKTTDNIVNDSTVLPDIIDRRIESLTAKATFGNVTYDENKFTLKNIDVTSGKKAKLVIRLYLSVDPNFDKDTIDISVSGTGVADKLAPVPVAKVKRPITVDAKTTEVQIGYQRYAVSDITITENAAGAIRRNSSGDKALKLAVTDGLSNNDIQFNTIHESQVKVTKGDLKVTFDSVAGGVIMLDVDRVSTVTSTITITGLEVKIMRNVPYGNYDLVVYGDSVFANYETTAAPAQGSVSAFEDPDDGFVTKNYISVATEGSNTTKVNTFKIQDGSKTVIINGETSTIADAPYISKTTNRFMLPTRWTAALLGVDETKDIIYSDATKTVTVMLPTRTVQFVVGSDIMTIASNGVTTQVKMDAKAENTNGRVFVPVYAIAQAYGAKLAYDDATKTATFN